jgi:hypothetical protein
MVERFLALAVLVASGVYLTAAWPLPMGTAARPGAGLYPLAVGVFGGAVSLAWLVSTLRRAPAGAGGVAAPDSRRRVGAAAALLVGYCLLLPWTGFPLAAFLFTALLLRGLGARWTAALGLGIVSAAAAYYLFAVLLGVPLPRGTWLD